MVNVVRLVVAAGTTCDVVDSMDVIVGGGRVGVVLDHFE
jgi:hypothetical protein